MKSKLMSAVVMKAKSSQLYQLVYPKGTMIKVDENVKRAVEI